MSLLSSNSNPKPKALLLGMVYSVETEPKRGQEFRDRVRCEALEMYGYDVYSLDNKHFHWDLEECKEGKHCTSNFCDARRMLRSVQDMWGHIQFDVIILDYFFSPSGWARERWTDRFFHDTIPQFASSAVLKKGGSIFLPHLPGVRDAVDNYWTLINDRYKVELVTDPYENPLYEATDDEKIREQLLRCPDNLVNETQLKPLLNFSSQPFLRLECHNDAPVFSHPSKRVYSSPKATSGLPSKVSPSGSDSETPRSPGSISSSSSASPAAKKRAVAVPVARRPAVVAGRAARVTNRARKLNF